MLVRINKFDYALQQLVHACDAAFDTWQDAKNMCERIWKQTPESVSITETTFTSGIKQCSVAKKQRIVYQITEVNDTKKQPAQTSIFGD